MPRRGVSRYQPLLEYLHSSQGSEVVLTVDAVEAVLGFPLPKMAQFGSWWRDISRSQVALWWDAGWRAHLDLRNQRVIFTHTSPEEGGSPALSMMPNTWVPGHRTEQNARETRQRCANRCRLRKPLL